MYAASRPNGSHLNRWAWAERKEVGEEKKKLKRQRTKSGHEEREIEEFVWQGIDSSLPVDVLIGWP